MPDQALSYYQEGYGQHQLHQADRMQLDETAYKMVLANAEGVLGICTDKTSYLVRNYSRYGEAKGAADGALCLWLQLIGFIDSAIAHSQPTDVDPWLLAICRQQNGTWPDYYRVVGALDAGKRLAIELERRAPYGTIQVAPEVGELLAQFNAIWQGINGRR